MNSIGNVFCKLISFCIPYRLIRGWKYFKRLIYSASVSRSLSSVGKKFMVLPDAYIEGGKNICIGDFFFARDGLRIEAYDKYNEKRYNPYIQIGNNVCMGENCHIGAISNITIGNHVLFGSKVFITDHFHGNTVKNDMIKHPLERELYSKGAVKIEDDVWIGEGVVILPNVIIGRNSIIGANSVVTKDILPYSVAAGVPAKIIKCLERENDESINNSDTNL